jgi:hypothetical protein
MELVQTNGAKDWFNIGSLMGQHGFERTGKQCRERFEWFSLVLRFPSSGADGWYQNDDRWMNQLAPDVVKDPWTAEEDRIIIDSQRLVGNKWVAISRLLTGRPANAVKNRWHGTLSRRLERRQIAVSGESRLAEANAEVPERTSDQRSKRKRDMISDSVRRLFQSVSRIEASSLIATNAVHFLTFRTFDLALHQADAS